MSKKGVMGIPSKPAYRSHRNAPTRKQLLRAERLKLAKELEEYCNAPFPAGAEIVEWNGVDGGMNPDGTIQRCIS